MTHLITEAVESLRPSQQVLQVISLEDFKDSVYEECEKA